MMKYNTIYTTEEYMKQGFTVEEVPMVREHDRLYNKTVDGLATQEEIDRMHGLVKVLGL